MLFLQLLIEEGQAAARDEEAMKAKWIARCLSFHREKLEKAEGKSKASADSTRTAETSSGTDTRTDRNDDQEGNGEGEGEGDGDGIGSDEDGEGVESGEDPEVAERPAEKKFSGGFSLEQCVAAVRLKAREREEAAQNRNPEASAGTGGLGKERQNCEV